MDAEHGTAVHGNGRQGQADGTTGLSPQLTLRLQHLARAIPPAEIAELWIFPPLLELEGSAEFLIFTRFFNGRGRRVYSARLPAGESNGTDHEHQQEIVEHGSVPHDRLPRIVERFQRRLGENREPVHVAIEGRTERWDALLAVAPEPPGQNGTNAAGPNGQVANTNGAGAPPVVRPNAAPVAAPNGNPPGAARSDGRPPPPTDG